MPIAYALQHIESEEMGHTEEWLRQNNYDIHRVRLYQGDELPDPKKVDYVIGLGGPMSVNGTAEYPWLTKEIDFLRAVLQRPIPVLGICLGAQLLAKAKYASIVKAQEQEIGWYPIQSYKNTRRAIPGFSFPDTMTVLHWHGETFELPKDSTLLASSEACTNQAFVLKPYQVGLQFHLEADLDSVRTMLEHSQGEMANTGPYTQSSQSLLAKTEEFGPEAKTVLFDLMTAMRDAADRQAKASNVA